MLKYMYKQEEVEKMNFNNNEFTLLSDEQTFGSQQIDVIKKMLIK